MALGTDGPSRQLIAAPIPAKYPRCRYCASELPSKAIYCANCSKYQQVYKNWLSHLGTLIAATGVTITIVTFILTNEATKQKELTARQAELETRKAELAAQEQLRELDRARAIAGSVTGVMVHAARALERLVVDYRSLNAEFVSVSRRRAVTQGEGELQVLDEDCGFALPASDTRCRLVVSLKFVGGMALVVPVTDMKEMDRATAYAQALRIYLEKVDAIARAESKEQLKSALDSTLGSLMGLGRVLGLPYELPYDVPAVPDEDSLGNMRAAAFEFATAAANPLLSDSSRAIKDFNFSEKSELAYAFTNLVQDSLFAFSRSSGPIGYDRVVNAALGYDAFLTVDPTDLMLTFSSIHSLWTEKLSKGASLAEVHARMADLEAQIATTSARLANLRKLGTSFLENLEAAPMPR